MREVILMWGLPVAFIIGYAVARWFGDHVQAVAKSAYHEIGKVIEEWF